MTTEKIDQEQLRTEYHRKGLAYGMAIFPAIGVVLSLATGTYALLASGVALALTLGPAYGEYLYQQEISLQHREKEMESESD